MRTALEALFDAMISDGWANEFSGNVEAPTGHFARISNSEEELFEITEAFADVIEVYGMPARDDIIGHFLVITNSQGFIFIEEFPSQLSLIDAYRALENDYDAWESKDIDA